MTDDQSTPDLTDADKAEMLCLFDQIMTIFRAAAARTSPEYAEPLILAVLAALVCEWIGQSFDSPSAVRSMLRSIGEGTEAWA